MPRNIRKACCAAFSLALGSGPTSVVAQIDDADRPGAPAETREDRRYGKQLEAPSPLLFRLPGTGQAAPPQRLTYQYSYAGEAEATYRRDPDLDRRVRDNVSLVKPQVNGIIVYRPTDSLEATLEMVLEREIPSGMPFADTIAAIREQGSLVYLPHPFDRMHSIPDAATLRRHIDEIDIFEVYNARLLFEAYNEEALRFARKYNLTMGAGSDAHVLQGVGTGAVRMRRFEGPEEFLISLRSAEILRRPKSLAYLQSLKWVAQVKEKVR